MHKLELLTQAQATCQALCRTLPACCSLKPVSGLVWAVGKHAVFQVTVWKKLLPGVMPQPAAEAPGARPLLVTEYVDEAASEQLRAQGLCYLDLAGNAWLQHPAAEELFVLIQGRPRYRKPVRPGVTFRRDGMRLLYYGLTEPHILAYDDLKLAEHSGLTLHILTRVLTDLNAQELLAQEPRRLLLSPALVERWAAAYPTTLRPRLHPQRYRWLDPNRAADWRMLPLGSASAWSGEAAAQLLLGEVGDQPTRLILYTVEDRENLCSRLGLKPHLHGTVELVRLFAEPFATPHIKQACVHPLLVYADLLALGTTAATQLAHRLAIEYLADLIPAAFPLGNNSSSGYETGAIESDDEE